MMRLDELSTPSVLVDLERLERNLRSMQSACDAHGVELWPHLKTHKMVAVAQRQLALGARGLTCAKLGEAEAMLLSGAQRLFIAYPLVDVRLAQRLAALAARIPELRLAVTSEEQAEALDQLVSHAGLKLPVMMALDAF